MQDTKKYSTSNKKQDGGRKQGYCLTNAAWVLIQLEWILVIPYSGKFLLVQIFV